MMNYFGAYHADIRPCALSSCDLPRISRGSISISAAETATTPEKMSLFYGVLRNRSALARELNCGPYADPAQLILSAYEIWGTEYIDHIEGPCISCIADIPNDRLLLARDRMGECCLFYAQKGNQQKTKKQLIVVAVECNHEGNRRLIEYSPVDFENATLGKIRGKGRIYMNWLVKTLKPAIDARLRTLPDRSHTYICGSSMGGLMSIYAAVNYNKFFQRAACLSPSVWVSPEKMANLIAKSRMRPDTYIYMDYGSRELYNHDTNTEALVGVMDQLLHKQVYLTFRIVPGGTHSEASWEKQIPVFMDCLQI